MTKAYEYVNRTYRKNIAPGARVSCLGKFGTVMRPLKSHMRYVRVRLDGEKRGRLYHPDDVVQILKGRDGGKTTHAASAFVAPDPEHSEGKESR